MNHIIILLVRTFKLALVRTEDTILRWSLMLYLQDMS